MAEVLAFFDELHAATIRLRAASTATASRGARRGDARNIQVLLGLGECRRAIAMAVRVPDARKHGWPPSDQKMNGR